MTASSKTAGMRLRHWLAGLALAGCAMGSSAAQIAGQTFDDAATVAGTELALNGVGLRTLFIIKAYVAGLYVPRRSTDAAELLAQKGPRRLSLKMLTDMTAERMIRAFREGIERNVGEPGLSGMRPQLEQLAGTMKAVGTARRGDTVDIDLVDGATRITLNGKPRGEPIEGEDFYAAILRVFLGSRPADPDLKKGLLGG